MDYPADFRRELSEAFSLLYFLRPHSLILSAIEGQPLSTYVDQTAYDEACMLYVGNDSPILDHLRTSQALNRTWRQSPLDLRLFRYICFKY